MNNLLGYEELPIDIKEQIHEVTAIWKMHLGDDLIGVYLHGSIVLNTFNSWTRSKNCLHSTQHHLFFFLFRHWFYRIDSI